jgi:hypothetical protein
MLSNGASQAPLFQMAVWPSLNKPKVFSISSRATVPDFSKGAFKYPSIHAPKVHPSFIQFIPPKWSFTKDEQAHIF